MGAITISIWVQLFTLLASAGLLALTSFLMKRKVNLK
jgi:hypothetical protein